jgi:transposase
MNSNSIFEIALGLESPWYVKETKLLKPEDKHRGQLDIYIDFKVGSKFKDDQGAICRAGSI